MEMRVNIYGFPHKGIRNGLGKLSFLIGKLNLENTTELEKVSEISKDLKELLSLHLHSEENHVLTNLEAKVPGSTTHNHEDHEKMEQLEHEMSDAIELLLEHKDMPHLVNAYNKVNYFIREYFRHMDEEEQEINQVIWDNFNDGEILEWQGKILSELTPEQFFKWFKYIIPSLTPFEQQIMLGGFKENAPAEAYNHTIAGLESYVTQDQFTFIKSI
jgi:hypothetical protein